MALPDEFALLLDTFNRPDEGPPPSANWTDGFLVNTYGLRVSGNLCVGEVTGAGLVHKTAYWNPRTFGPDCVVMATVGSITGAGGELLALVARATDPGIGTTNGYEMHIGSTPTHDGFSILRIDAGSGTTILGPVTSSVVATGDIGALTIIGSTLTAWHKPIATGIWVNVGSVTDATYTTAGYAGLVVYEATDGLVTCDNFAAGTIVSGTSARGFDGVSEYITLANESNFDFEFNQTFSVACWHLNSGGNAGMAVVAKQDLVVASDDRGWILFQRAGGTNPTYTVELANNTSTRAATRTTSEWAGNIWRHVGFSYSGSGTTAGTLIYVSGISQAKTDIADTLASSTILNAIPVQLGARNGTGAPSFFMNGKLAGIGIWNVVLTAAEFRSLAQGANPLSIQNGSLIASLPLCGIGSTEPDKKGTNNGTLTGTTTVNGPMQFSGCQGDTTEWLFTT
jgi:Concanavalin A-like lectin/glucanases superfamily